MADNLESYFKKHLSDENPAEENWNVPSEEVWNNVLPEIKKKRGLFIPWKYLYIIGALLFVGLAIILWPVVFSEDVSEQELLSTPIPNTISNQENPGASTKNQAGLPSITTVDVNQGSSLQKSKSSLDESNQLSVGENKQGETISVAQYIDQNKQQLENEILKENIPADKVYQNTSKYTIKSSGTIITPNTTADKEQQKLSDEKNLAMLYDDNPTKLERDEIYIAYLEQRKTNNLSSVDELNDNPGFTRQTVDIPLEFDKKKLEPFDNKRKVGIGAFYAPTWNGTSLNGNPQTGEIQTSDMLLYSGNWGFDFKYFISNRFAVVTGVEKSEIKSWSKSLVDFSYDTSTEHSMPDGEKENTSAVPMQTPFGEIETEVTYRFAGDQQIPDGEVMNSELETHQEIRYLSIPLGVEFNILRFSRFSWFAEAGVRYNRALKDATQFSSRILHGGDDMAVVDEKMMSYPTYTENFMNFYIGTGMNYQFSSKFQINASGRYFGNITDVNLQGNMSTYVHGYSLKIGILYLF